MSTVLVIEDNDNNMELITFLLTAHGYETLRAQTGRDGVARALDDQPDFVLLDVQLPDIDGFEVVRSIRNQQASRNLPVIAMTSYAMAGDRERLLAAGCQGYIEKPIDPMRVMDQIKEILRALA